MRHQQQLKPAVWSLWETMLLRTAAGRGGGRTGLVRAPGVVCRASADLHCLAHQSDGGTPSETLPGSTKTGTSGKIKLCQIDHWPWKGKGEFRKVLSGTIPANLTLLW